MQSQSVEDFLKAIYILQQKMERVSTNALAEARSISAPSVTDMARRMVEAGLIDYQRYYGMRLTPEGEKVALKVIRRHRLIELYLVEELGYALHEVHDEAENLEHAVSDRFIDAIAEKLNNPKLDPHGDPIPTEAGEFLRRHLIPLSELQEGKSARVGRFIAESDTLLQHILERGFTLNVVLKMIHLEPFNGPITLEMDGEELIIGHTVATSILVDPIK